MSCFSEEPTMRLSLLNTLAELDQSKADYGCVQDISKVEVTKIFIKNYIWYFTKRYQVRSGEKYNFVGF